MKKVCFLLALLAFSLAGNTAYSQSRVPVDLYAKALELCRYIPDHGLRDDAREYLTPEYFRAYSEAIDAPDGEYNGVGESEWLYYFVTGSGGADPSFTVQSVSRINQTLAVANITVQEIWDYDDGVAGEKFPHTITMALIDGKWLLDDYDNTKQQCRDYVRVLRAKYKSGDIIRELQSDDYTRTFIPEFRQRLEEFYRKYGREDSPADQPRSGSADQGRTGGSRAKNMIRRLGF